jgi:metal-responsive CopG/Arc/MetJ family transcriptional regulator
MKDTMTTVGVRLTPAVLKRLDEEAGKRSVTRSECLRQITEEGLNDERVKLLLEEVRELRQLVLLLDKRWKIGLVALLADAGKASVEDAEAFVRESLS